MKIIPLNKGLQTSIDDNDFEWLSKKRWYAHYGGAGRFYAKWRKRNPPIRLNMAREIMAHHFGKEAILGKEIDHINGNSLDNRKLNLRIVTHSENMKNTLRPKNNSSGFKGVFKSGSKKKPWASSITVNGKQVHLGHFSKKITAALAYDYAAKKLHGTYARLNFLQVVPCAF